MNPPQVSAAYSAVANEEFYDTEIAPVLKRLGEMCEARKMSMVACVEYDPENAGIGRTETMQPDRKGCLSAAQRLTHWAARSHGNIDALMMAVDRHAREHGHSSIYLRMAGNNNVKYDGSESCAIAITSPK